MKRTWTCIVVLALVAAPAAAQVPAGSSFVVNTYGQGDGFQLLPGLSSSADGGFVVTWTSIGQDGDQHGVFAQRFGAAGARLGGEFQVNAYTTNRQGFSTLAVDRAGGFVVAWQSLEQDGYDYGVFARRYNSNAAALGGEIAINAFTGSRENLPSVAAGANGGFVVAWTSRGQDGDGLGAFARRVDAGGAPLGSDFQIDTVTTGFQTFPAVASDALGNFVVAWGSYLTGSGMSMVFGRLFDADGTARGAPFPLAVGAERPSAATDGGGNFIVAWQDLEASGPNHDIHGIRFAPDRTILGFFAATTYTTGEQHDVSVAADEVGNFVAVWRSAGPATGGAEGIYGVRLNGAGSSRGAPFRVDTGPCCTFGPRVTSDAVGNFVVAWTLQGPPTVGMDVIALRYGGLLPQALSVDAAGNGVLEPGETVNVRPTWRNANGAAQSFAGTITSFTGPAGATYTITDGAGDYGTVADGASAPCSDCYVVAVSAPATRPALHWDARALESILPDAQGQQKRWALHVGGSFTDVPGSSGFYRFVETLLHRGVTAGCGGASYCPGDSTSRAQMAVFVLAAHDGAGRTPPACGTPVFGDVPATSVFCPSIEELARRGVVAGCGNGLYCPDDAVTREQMAVFVLRTLDPALSPPQCTTPVFGDVPAASPFCRWIEELARRGIVAGCGGGNYCPGAPVTREQMAVFLTATFGLTLYGP